MTDSAARENLDSIAIIGMTGRFPEAANVEEFWENLCAGRESIKFFTDEELATAGIRPAALKNSNYVKAGTVLEGLDLFDAAFFNFSPREAELIDPQQRLFLECAWEVLESAGYDPARIAGRVGVYGGVGIDTYLLRNLYRRNLFDSPNTHKMALGNDKDFLSTRVSYKLNLRGPSISIQTACSTSLVAVHLACQSLLMYQCDMALAGGVSLRVPQKTGYFYEEEGILSPDGHCRPFDASARGTIFGSGLGIVLLKRLGEALADGDQIRAVIRGSAINNDGALKVGYTAPSVSAQAEVVIEALAAADVSAGEIGYVECHGTGTALGDPIEIAALTKAFAAQGGAARQSCAIGSVKSNIGHLDTAAGVTGLIKAVLMVERGQLPASLHYERANPEIEFAGSPFVVNTELREWERKGREKRVAGVSSFGMGGTNAHVVIEEAPERERDERTEGDWQLLVVSARTEAGVERAARQLAAHLRRHEEIGLADVAYTTQVGRQAMRYRRAVVCRTATDAARELDTIHPANAVDESITRPVVFMFTGQGSQYLQMGHGLYRTQPIFREHVDQCSALLQSMLGYDLRSLLYPTTADHSEATCELNQTRTTQPALFVIEYALARLWMSWGICPQAMIGHSIGEYVAACLAGVLTLEDALKLVVTRARLMQEMPPGSMLGVSLGEVDARALLNEDLSLATINRPDRCVISGPTDAVQELARQLGKKGVPYQPLHTSHAFHSQMMAPIIEPFVEHVKTVILNAPQIPYISNVTGQWVTTVQATDPEYWGRHLRQAVRFSDGVQELLKEPNHVLLEVGPGTTLTTLAKQQGKDGQIPTVVSSLRHPNQKQDDEFVILQALAQLFLAGVEINWSAVHNGLQRRRVQLPTYPFERARYWVESVATGDDESAPDERRALDDWFYVPDWKRTVPAADGRSNDNAPQKTRLLMFVDTCGLADAVSEIFCAEGRELIKVNMGEDFARLDQESYTINAARPEDYTQLFADLRERSLLPEQVVHLWGVTASAEQLSFEETQRRGFYSLLWLARAAAGNSDILDISVVTNDMQAASAGETLNADKATVLGGCRVIPQEYSNITCRSIDVILPAAGDARRRMVVAEHLISEIDSDEREPVIAYRGPYRLVQSYERVHLKPSENGARGLREGGVYLITGGMGGIGYTLAKYLAESVRAKLILVSRNALPDSQPGELLKNQDGRMAQVKTLEDLGAEVLVVNADIADEAELRAAIDRATVRFGRIHGVIHAAGVAGGGVIQFKTEDEVARVWAPKIKGALLLDAAFKDDQLDFLIFCSSVKSMLAEFGQSDYCSSSIFLDTLAHSLRSAGVAATSINWDTWREVGMAVDSQSEGVLGVLQEQNLSVGISPVEGIDVFERVLASRLPQVVVSVRDLESRMVSRNASASLSEQLGNAVENSPSYPRPQLSTPYVAPANTLEQKIADVWQRMLGIQQIGVHDNFFDLGGDSLTAVQIAAQLKKEFGVPIPVVKLFEGPTISSLAGILDPKTEANPAFARRQERGARRRKRRKVLATGQS
ncbi:MAG TPA: SDR family NAD(P)-dependent oxidoreductase [Pyrinomonadaceae bacterium]|nr:SDR family NAD(P)-dependent oxidoreductase [Pyrinomonadaceae bacterium]